MLELSSNAANELAMSALNDRRADALTLKPRRTLSSATAGKRTRDAWTLR